MNGLRIGILLGALLSLAAPDALAAGPAVRSIPYALLDTNVYQSFVKNWTPSSAPLLRVIDSAAGWYRVFAPAAVMGRNRPFAPPASFWAHHAVLLVARVVSAGDGARVLTVQSLTSTSAGVVLRYTFRPTPAASSTMKVWMGVVVAVPQRGFRGTAVFKENGRTDGRLSIK